MLACGDDDTGESTTKLDAAQLQDAAVARDATVDGSRLIPTDGSTMRDGSSVRDASAVHDGSTTRDGARSDGAGDASSDTSLREACFRPFTILDDAGAASAQSGCACSLSDGAGYCVRRASRIGDWDRYEAVVCLQGSWALVSDGPCFPSAPAEAAQCSSAGGTVVPAATVGDAGAPVVITVCPLSSHLLGGVKGAACAALRSRPREPNVPPQATA